MRKFETGATKDSDETKHDYEGFYSPIVMERFAEYMTKHRIQADGEIRASDNWQKGIPFEAYMKSVLRHVQAWHANHRGFIANEEIEDAICAVLFNAQGYLFELLKHRKAKPKPGAIHDR